MYTAHLKQADAILVADLNFQWQHSNRHKSKRVREKNHMPAHKALNYKTQSEAKTGYGDWTCVAAYNHLQCKSNAL